jgi:hypothetical protein
MPFCPICKYEYREGINLCPDDQAKLVDVLAVAPVEPRDRARYEDWTAILASDSPDKIEALREMLVANGIEATVDTHFSLPVSSGLSEFRLWVKDGQAFAAQRLIEDFLPREFPEDEREGFKQPPMSRRKRIVLGAIAIYSIAFLIFFFVSQAFIISYLLRNDQMPNLQPGLGFALCLPGLVQSIGAIYYLIQILVTAETPPGEKMVWMAMVFFASAITLPIHYYRFIWEPLHLKS